MISQRSRSHISQLIALACLLNSLDLIQSRDSFAVFGYLPEYRLHNFDYDGAFQTGLTHLIYFSLEVDPQTHLPSALDRLPPKEEIARARKAADAVGGKILLGFGGNARSQGFGEMATSSRHRKTFIQALDNLLVDLALDGVDYNWEYPKNENEWEAWGHLMKETKDSILGGDRSQNLVTFTMYLDPRHYDVIRHFNLLADADYIHCMAYDQPGKHSTVTFAKEGLAYAKSKFSENLYKFTLGVPFYGRHMSTGEPQTFYDLWPSMKNNKSNEIGSIFYNSQKTLMKKVELAWKANVGGIMIWELGQDLQPFSKPESLMHGIQAGLLSIQHAALENESKEEL